MLLFCCRPLQFAKKQTYEFYITISVPASARHCNVVQHKTCNSTGTNGMANFVNLNILLAYIEKEIYIL